MPKNIAGYTINAVIFVDPFVEVYVASNATENPDKKYILNIIRRLRDNADIFTSFFQYQSQKNLSVTPAKFDVLDGDFYIAFDYTQGLSIQEMFKDGKYSISYEKRLELLSNILIAINDLNGVPLPIVLSVSEIDNVLIGDDYSICFRFALKSEYINIYADQHLVMRNLSQIIGIILAPELKLTENSHLRIIHKSCAKNLYLSIPELIYALNNSPVESGFNPVTAFVNKSKKRLRKLPLNKIAVFALLAFVVIFAYQQITSTKVSFPYSPVETIGIITYTKDIPDETVLAFSNLTSSETGESEIEVVPSVFSIAPDSEVDFELYIFAPGDTLDTVCLKYYPDLSFVSVIESFNGFDKGSVLPGDIIKIPNLTQTLDILRQQ